MNPTGILKRSRIISVIRNAVIIVGSIVIILVATRVPHAFQQQKAKQVISELEHIKITVDDVRGTNLPPVPDEVENNKTVAGIDTNKNYIRDDIEQYIHTTYPNSERMRAVLLQYAQALQLQLLVPTGNSEIWVAVVKKESSVINCNVDTANYVDPSKGELYKIYVDLYDKDIKNIYRLTINNQQRRAYLDKFYKSISSYGSSNLSCDINYEGLQN